MMGRLKGDLLLVLSWRCGSRRSPGAEGRDCSRSVRASQRNTAGTVNDAFALLGNGGAFGGLRKSETLCESPGLFGGCRRPESDGEHRQSDPRAEPRTDEDFFDVS